jgi:uncharacterized radical SAM protein YgiQ
MNFLPTNIEEMKKLGWKECDIILITGDAYIDHPSFGTAVIGRFLESYGYKVGVIPQPMWNNINDFTKLGRPKLFFGINSGNVDSMLSNYTALKKPRRIDPYSPYEKNEFRPDRSLIIYTNRIKEAYKDIPVALGGIEASMRRLAHYDFWNDSVRRSMLVDTKADILVYGMGEKPILEIAQRLNDGNHISSCDNIRGTVVIKKNIDDYKNIKIIPSYEEVCKDKNKFNEAYKTLYNSFDPSKNITVIQKHNDRFIVHNPPVLPLTTKELDSIYELPYTRKSHPMYNSIGGIKALEIVRWSITSHRGCPGECSFCSLSLHQGRIIQSRSEQSLIKEAKLLASSPDFKGTITDIGGPTANLFCADCSLWNRNTFCSDKNCLMPNKCSNLKLGYDKAIELYRKIKQIPKVKHVFISSGLRYDLLVDNYSDEYLEELMQNHISGRIKIAPEHIDDKVLRLMNKPNKNVYEKFINRWKTLNKKLNKNLQIMNYFINAHPGSTLKEAKNLADYCKTHHLLCDQMQDFIPLPLTISSCMYYTGLHPFTNEPVSVTREYKDRAKQRELLEKSIKNKS